MSLESTSVRPEDNAFNIQCGWPLSCISMGGPCSISLSPMDKSSSSGMDYTKRVTFTNNAEAETLNPSSPVNNTALLYNFILSPSQPPRVCNKETSTPASNSIIHILLEPSSPTAIPYSANVPANPSLWDGNFMATSLFDINEFCNSDVCNMVCSFQQMVCFLRQRNLEGCNNNNIP